MPGMQNARPLPKHLRVFYLIKTLRVNDDGSVSVFVAVPRHCTRKADNGFNEHKFKSVYMYRLRLLQL